MKRGNRLILLWCFWMLGVIGGSVAANNWKAIRQVLALSESTKAMPANTAFNASGYDDNSGLVAVTGTEVKLARNPTWWNTDYRFKRQITVKNLGSSAVATNTTAQLTTDLSTLGLGTTKLQSDLDDLRVVYSVGNTHTEVNRTITQAIGQTNVATITFPLSAGIGITNSDTGYALYYGNTGATAPANSGYNIGSATATFVAPFLGSTMAVVAGGSASPTTATGAIRFSGQKSALSFDGKDDSVTVSIGSTLASDYTVEMWVFQKGTNQAGLLNGTCGSTVEFTLETGTPAIGKCNDYMPYYSTSSISLNQWTHVAFTVNGSRLVTYYINGVASGTSDLSASNTTISSSFVIGNSFRRPIIGYIDEYRISNTVRYTSNFTPSTSPFVPDANTKLLLHFDENGDDPRNSGKAIDASGNGNHGTITGAKYVDGLVGNSNGTSDTGQITIQPYAGHGGIMLEEGTTNFIYNPSFENATAYNVGWSLPYFNLGSGATTFTAAMSKRNSAGPFAAGVAVQGKYDASGTPDVLSFSRGSQIAGTFYQNYDPYQGSIVFWITPEWNGNDNATHTLFMGVSNGTPNIMKKSDNTLCLYQQDATQYRACTDVSSWTAGSTYLVTGRWDYTNTFNGTSHFILSVGDTHTFGTNSIYDHAWGNATYYIGSDGSQSPANALIEGLTIYRRPLWDGAYGVNVGNGDEINLINNSGAGQDPTLVTGSWDVVFALPTNATTGTLGAGTTAAGEAWTHPHLSNALYTSTTNTGGFMMAGTMATDGWANRNSSNNYGTGTTVFTAAMSKRNSAGPFAAGVMVQGERPEVYGTVADSLTYPLGNQVAGNFYSNFDVTQGSVVFWFTPEWEGTAWVGSRKVMLYSAYGNSTYLLIYRHEGGALQACVGNVCYSPSNSITSWTPGNTYLMVLRWDLKNTLDGTNYMSMSIGDSQTFGATSLVGSTFAPNADMRIGTDWGNMHADGIIEGLTYYRRPLWDGQYGVNAGNGDEINQIWNNGSGQDPTLVTGSWDVVFALPTNASTGSLGVGGTGQAWSHPHSSNVLYVGTTKTGGFMMDANYTTAGWHDEGTPVGAGITLATAEKIFQGGYKWTNDAANEGIGYTLTGLTAGQNYVVRAVAHSDATSIPKVQIWDNTNNAEITSLTGTVGSGRTAPDILLFTFELPTTARNGSASDCTAIEVRLLNTQSSGTVYWHQIELLANSYDNPSFETGSGDPWIPSGWVNAGFGAGQLMASSTVHSGSSAVQIVNGSGVFRTDDLGPANGGFYALGFWGINSSGTNYLDSESSVYRFQNSLSSLYSRTFSGGTFTHRPAVVRATSTFARIRVLSSNGSGYVDDVYAFGLNGVSLTVTPASLANSTETTGVRVDGADVHTETPVGMTKYDGSIRFNFTPRHNFNIGSSFGVANPVIMTAYADANNYIKLHKSAATTLQLIGLFGGTQVAVGWTNPTLNAGTSYAMAIDYANGGSLNLRVNGTLMVGSTGVGLFTTTPTTIYWGTDNGGGGSNPYDGTYQPATANYAVAPLATAEKIYPGGYKWTNDEINQGVGATLTGLTAGQNYVVRAVANSDGTSIPKVQIWDNTNNAEITSLTGTVGSGRTAPDILLFTFELPTTARNGVASNCTAIEVRLLNTQVSGTVYWHQVELLVNLVDNPSLETGASDPWIPSGWVGGGPLDSGESARETTALHSGGSSVKYMAVGTNNYLLYSISGLTTSNYYSLGGWIKAVTSNSTVLNYGRLKFQNAYGSACQPGDAINLGNTGSFTHYVRVAKYTGCGASNFGFYSDNLSSREVYMDDLYAVSLTGVTLTMTPATQANSSETTGLRVDGTDTLTSPISGWTAKLGTAKFMVTPRHSFGVGSSFGVSAPVLITLGSGSTDFIKVYKTGGTLATVVSMNGTTAVANWSSPTLNAGTSYPFIISYGTGSTLLVNVGGTQVASVSIGTGTSFSSVPATAYFGSDASGTNQYDATITNFVSLTPSENTTAPYYKFGSKSLKLINNGSMADEYAIQIGATNSNAFSAYVYDGTSGNVGGTVDATIAQLSIGSTSIGTTYTDTGGGWWRLNGGLTAIGDTRAYGIQVKAGKTVYVDGVQIERKAYTTTYTDGSLGVGYTWTGTANNSVSSRTAGDLRFATSGNLSASAGTISVWFKSQYNAGGYERTIVTTCSNNAPICNGENGFHFGLYGLTPKFTTNDGVSSGGIISSSQAVSNNVWSHIVATWTGGAATAIYVNNIKTAGSGQVMSSLGSAAKIGWLVTHFLDGSSYTDGLVSDLRVYSNALSDNEVSDLYWSGLISHQSGSEGVDRYNSSGTYISPVMDLSANGQWGAVPVVFTDNAAGVGGSATYYTRTSADNVTWGSWLQSTAGNIASDPRRYVQWKVNLTSKVDQSETPTVSNMVVAYVEDTNAPDNPAAAGVIGYSAGVGTTVLTSGSWYNYESPAFVWGTGADTSLEGQSASGISKYHVLLSTDVGATPASMTGSSCYLSAGADSRQYIVGTTPAGCTLSDGTYYLRMQTEDNSGNVSVPVTMFTYKHDASNPNAPSSVSSDPIGYSSVDSFKFYWPTATDNGPGGVAGYQYKTGASSGAYSDWQTVVGTEITGVPSYQEGQNIFYVRTRDNAGNVSSITTNIGMATYYYNESAPTAPRNLAIAPTTTVTAPAASNSFTVTWDEPESYSGAIGKYYYCVNCTPADGVMTEITGNELADRTLTGKTLATQQGKNTFYIMAEDNNINTATGHGNRNFEAYASIEFYASTVAPGAPSNVSVSDASDRSNSKWRLALAWDVGTTQAGVTVDHYEIYRSTNNSTFTRVGTATGLAYTDGSLTQSTTYYYKLKAIDNAGSASDYSSTVSAKPEGRYNSPPPAGGTPSATPGSTTALIAWTTTRTAYGSVEYGESTTYGNAGAGSTLTTNHSIKITGLAPGKTYHYRVLSLDDSSLVGYERSAAYSADYSFTTLTTAEISGIEVDEVGLDNVTISWKTRTMSTTEVDYGLTTEYGLTKTITTTSSENSHTVRLTDLAHSSKYHFRIKGKTVDGDNIVSADYTFETITFPKVTAYVLKTDQSAGGTIISVAWSTNVPTTSLVDYQMAEIEEEGMALSELEKMSQEELSKIPIRLSGATEQKSAAALTGTHLLKLDSLKDGVIYIITLRGRDKYGNEAVSDPIRYVTGKDTRPPVLSGVTVETQLSGSGANSTAAIVVSWETDEAATTQVVYGAGAGTNYDLSTAKEEGLTKRHLVVIRDLQVNSSYHLKIVSTDETGNEVKGEDLIVVTPGVQESALDVLLFNLEEVFGFLKI